MTDRETRKRLLQTAFRLFHEQGYHATGVATIMREAQINPGSMYHYFESKDDLLLGVLRFALDYLRPAVMGPAEARTTDPLGRVFSLLALYRRGMKVKGCKLGCPIGNLALEVSDDHPPARDLIHRNFENWIDHVHRWLESAGDLLPAGLDRRQLARFVLTVMEGGLMQSRAAGHLGPFDDSVAQLRNYFDLLTLRRAGGRKRSRQRRAKENRQ